VNNSNRKSSGEGGGLPWGGVHNKGSADRGRCLNSNKGATNIEQWPDTKKKQPTSRARTPAPLGRVLAAEREDDVLVAHDLEDGAAGEGGWRWENTDEEIKPDPGVQV